MSHPMKSRVSTSPPRGRKSLSSYPIVRIVCRIPQPLSSGYFHKFFAAKQRRSSRAWRRIRRSRGDAPYRLIRRYEFSIFNFQFSILLKSEPPMPLLLLRLHGLEDAEGIFDAPPPRAHRTDDSGMRRRKWRGIPRHFRLSGILDYQESGFKG